MLEDNALDAENQVARTAKKPRIRKRPAPATKKLETSEDDASDDGLDSEGEEEVATPPPTNPELTFMNASPAHNVGNEGRATRRATLPVPVPNLTKKSRGRRVPIKTVAQSEETPEGDKRSYVCKVEGCGKCFHRGEHLKRHIRSIHTHEKRESLCCSCYILYLFYYQRIAALIQLAIRISTDTTIYFSTSRFTNN